MSSLSVTDVKIKLTRQEERLFQTLEATAIDYEDGLIDLPPPAENDANDAKKKKKTNSSEDDDSSSIEQQQRQKIEIRIAGGWVRDKLLNEASDDVDVTVNCMTGVQFATLIQSHLHLKKKNETTGDDVTVPKVAIIEANPDQSKHLQTATMNLHDLDCDFVHLRGEETYTSDSRIPQHVSNATPYDDAVRRDFTVNSLFYNVRTQLVEDWTNRGIHDLMVNKCVRTPIDCLKTFNDDPLRLLRAVRFTIRLSKSPDRKFTLHPDITQACQDVKIKQALMRKVSRERVGKEMDGMFTGKNAKGDEALVLLGDLSLLDCIFSFPFLEEEGGNNGNGSGPKRIKKNDEKETNAEDEQNFNISGSLMGFDYQSCNNNLTADNTTSPLTSWKLRQIGWTESVARIRHLSKVLSTFEEHHQQSDDWTCSKSIMRIIHLSTFLHPIRNLNYLDSKQKPHTVISYIIKESLKFTKNDVKIISTIMENVDEMQAILRETYLLEKEEFCRLKLGLLLRRLQDSWPIALIAASISEIRQVVTNGSDTDNDNVKRGGEKRVLDLMIQFYKDVVTKHKLDQCWKMKPFLNGRDLILLFEEDTSSSNKEREKPSTSKKGKGKGKGGGKAGGRMIGEFMEKQIQWMLTNPNGTKVDCQEYLKILIRQQQKDKI